MNENHVVSTITYKHAHNMNCNISFLFQETTSYRRRRIEIGCPGNPKHPRGITILALPETRL